MLQTILNYIGEEKLQKFINFALRKLSEITLPAKRGTFIEFRSGLINVCPVGRSCTQAERDEFGEYDKVHKVREQLIEEFKKEFADYGLSFVIGNSRYLVYYYLQTHVSIESQFYKNFCRIGWQSLSILSKIIWYDVYVQFSLSSSFFFFSFSTSISKD